MESEKHCMKTVRYFAASTDNSSCFPSAIPVFVALFHNLSLIACALRRRGLLCSLRWLDKFGSKEMCKPYEAPPWLRTKVKFCLQALNGIMGDQKATRMNTTRRSAEEEHASSDTELSGPHAEDETCLMHHLCNNINYNGIGKQSCDAKASPCSLAELWYRLPQQMHAKVRETTSHHNAGMLPLP